MQDYKAAVCSQAKSTAPQDRKCAKMETRELIKQYTNNYLQIGRLYCFDLHKLQHAVFCSVLVIHTFILVSFSNYPVALREN